MHINPRNNYFNNNAIIYKNKFFNINSNIYENEYELFENKIKENNLVNNNNNHILDKMNIQNNILTQNRRYSPNIVNNNNNYQNYNYKDRFKKYHLKNNSMPIIIEDKNNNQDIDLSIINKYNNKPKYETISEPQEKRIYIKRNYNKYNNLERTITKPDYTNRIIKSQSEINIFNNNKNMNNYDHLSRNNYNKEIKYVGSVKERTDITNNELFDKYKNGDNNEYMDYKDKYKEISLFNKLFVENKNKEKLLKNNYNILNERNQLKKENEIYNKLILQDKLHSKEKQKIYKNLLDNQINHIIENKLSNENLSYKDFIKNIAYDRQKMRTPIREFLNKNDYVDVNPYNSRGNYLGESNLRNNTILNPRIQFKLNKYIFPKIINNRVSNDNLKY